MLSELIEREYSTVPTTVLPICIADDASCTAPKSTNFTFPDASSKIMFSGCHMVKAAISKLKLQ
jgi:hypothetical protein